MGMELQRGDEKFNSPKNSDEHNTSNHWSLTESMLKNYGYRNALLLFSLLFWNIETGIPFEYGVLPLIYIAIYSVRDKLWKVTGSDAICAFVFLC